jgi:hypothetical protein
MLKSIFIFFFKNLNVFTCKNTGFIRLNKHVKDLVRVIGIATCFNSIYFLLVLDRRVGSIQFQAYDNNFKWVFCL